MKTTAQTAQHTPGPWVECGQGTLLHPVTNNPITTEVVEAIGFGRIFEVYHYSNENEANARLIAAAPELLEALIALESGVRNWISEGVSPEMLASARAAIARAEGRSV